MLLFTRTINGKFKLGQKITIEIISPLELRVIDGGDCYDVDVHENKYMKFKADKDIRLAVAEIGETYLTFRLQASKEIKAKVLNEWFDPKPIKPVLHELDIFRPLKEKFA